MAKAKNPAFGVNGPACPICKGRMANREGKFGWFWGCTNFPRCRGIVNIKGTGSYKAYKPVERKVDIELKKGSLQQVAIWKFMSEGTGHGFVTARAGCGKTYTILQGAFRQDYKKKSIVYLAFNSAIQREAQAKSPVELLVKTMNAYGLSILVKNKIVKPNVPASRDKYSNLYQEMFPPANQTELNNQGQLARKFSTLVDYAMNYFVLNVNGNKITVDTQEMIGIVDKHDLQFNTQEEMYRLIERIAPVVQKGMKITEVITFNEQIWLPVVLNLPFPRQDWVLVDEAQDLNKLKQVFTMKAIGDSARALIVGDPAQAIYGFMGADADSMENTKAMLKEKGPVQEFTLSKTFRCGKEIVKFCNQYVPDFEADENNKQGQIIETDSETAEADGLYQPGVMVVCRLNAPLVQIAYRLIAKNIPVHYIGRDFGKSIVGLVKSLNPKNMDDLAQKLSAYTDRETNKLQSKSEKGCNVEDELQNLQDRTSCVAVFMAQIIQKIKEPTICQLLASMESFFRVNEEENGESKEALNKVRLSTIHRAKGLEADTVLWLQIPDKKGKPVSQQETNLMYVAASRAINTLLLVEYNKDAVRNDIRDLHHPVTSQKVEQDDDDNLLDY